METMLVLDSASLRCYLSFHMSIQRRTWTFLLFFAVETLLAHIRPYVLTRSDLVLCSHCGFTHTRAIQATTRRVRYAAGRRAADVDIPGDRVPETF